MRVHTIASRLHVQGASAPLRLRHSAGELTDGGGLLLVRRLWDRLGLGQRINTEAAWLCGEYRPSLMVELWMTLLLYGGGCMDDLRLLGGRSIWRLFVWKAVLDATTFGRWLRRGGERLAGQLDAVLWQMVRARWAVSGVPRSVMMVLDSTVVQRYGLKHAGAERGYNPTKKGRPSHHPLVAFLAGTGDCLGVRWRSGSAHTAAGAIPWIETMVRRLRAAGVEQITVRLDKGFFSRHIAEALSVLRFLRAQRARPEVAAAAPLALPAFAEGSHALDGLGRALRRAFAHAREAARDRGCRRRAGTAKLGGREDGARADQRGGHHGATAWRLYNQGALVEQRSEEMGQLSVGQTAVDDLGGNHLLWALGALAYQMLHIIRTALSGSWRRAQPKSLRAWLFRLPAKLTTHARKQYVQDQRTEPLRRELLQVLRRIGTGPPLPV